MTVGGRPWHEEGRRDSSNVRLSTTLGIPCQFVMGSYNFPEDLRDPERSTYPADFRIPVDTGRPPLFLVRMIKTASSGVLASLLTEAYVKL